MPEIVFAFFLRDFFDGFPDALPESLLGSPGAFSDQGFELREHHLNGVQVRGVRRQEEAFGTDSLDRRRHAGDLVGGQVVHDDDVAGFEVWYEELFDPAQKGRTVHRTIKDQRSDDPVVAQTRGKGRCRPVATGSFGHQALPAQAPSAQRCHIGSSPGLIDKDQLVRVQRMLRALPEPAGKGNIRAILFTGVQRFF